MRQTAYGILIPFLGTSLGAACVFLIRRQLSDAVQRILTGFAAGVMVAASVWSLLIPSMEQSADMGKAVCQIALVAQLAAQFLIVGNVVRRLVDGCVVVGLPCVQRHLSRHISLALNALERSRFVCVSVNDSHGQGIAQGVIAAGKKRFVTQVPAAC